MGWGWRWGSKNMPWPCEGDVNGIPLRAEITLAELSNSKRISLKVKGTWALSQPPTRPPTMTGNTTGVCLARTSDVDESLFFELSTHQRHSQSSVRTHSLQSAFVSFHHTVCFVSTYVKTSEPWAGLCVLFLWVSFTNFRYGSNALIWFFCVCFMSPLKFSPPPASPVILDVGFSVSVFPLVRPERPKTHCEHYRDSQGSQDGFPQVGAFIPECDEEGQYRPLQCHGSIGQCWCVDNQGQERAGTKTPRGTPPPNCDQPGENTCPAHKLIDCNHSSRNYPAITQQGWYTCVVPIHHRSTV